MLWIIVTLCAVCLQLGRNTLSKRLSEQYAPASVSLARFLPGLPVAAFLFLLLVLGGETVRITAPLYFVWASAMAVTQILANVLLVVLFKRKNFAVSVSLVKSETVLLALLCVPILGERIGLWEWAGILTATVGIMAAVLGKRPKGQHGPAGVKPRGPGSSILRGIFSLNTLIAFGAGLCLALATIFLKMSYAFIESDTRTGEVGLSLVLIMAIQSLILIAPVLVKNRADFIGMVRRPLLPFLTGLASAAGTFCWFTAFSLVPLSWVRTLGQSEFILACLVSWLVFKERLKLIEIGGMAAVAAGTLMIVLSNAS